MRQVDRQDQDGRRAGSDGLVAGFAESRVEPAAALAHRAGTGREGEAADGVVRRDDERLCDAGRGHRGADRRVRQAEDEVVPLLGVEHLAEPGLGAVQAADRDHA